MSELPTYQSVSVTDRRNGSALNIFYREAGHKDDPVVLLLHGFPTSSHQYRGLIDRLSYKYRVLAPDLPGFGFSDSPAAKDFGYTFDHLAEIIESFTDVLGLSRTRRRRIEVICAFFSNLARPSFSTRTGSRTLR
ncbi:MAG: alpha/beta fold hydrolase [Terracidiphilus sp.]|jgi:pimeloyl-ACP methyl ester carboxylesterase